jgi:hypothetical protein
MLERTIARDSVYPGLKLKESTLPKESFDTTREPTSTETPPESSPDPEESEVLLMQL